MKYIKLILIIIILIPLTGCYNYRELNDLGITTAIGISKKDDEFNLVIEVLKTDEKSDESKMPKYVLYESKGKTIQEAVRKAILKSPKRLYVNHLYMILIDEELAKEGINDIIDLFFRDSESRKQFYVLISKDDVYEVLNTKPLLEDINAKSIADRLKVNDDFLSNTVPTTFSKLLTKYVNPRIDMVIPSIKLIGNDESKNIVIGDTAIFKDDKLIGYINNEESLYYSLIDNNVNDTVLTTMINGEYVTIEINNSDTKIDIKDNNLKIKIKLSGNIAEINSNTNLTNPNTVNEIEKYFEEDLNKKILKLINKEKEYDTDIFGFTDLIYKKDNKNFNNTKLKDLTFDIDTKVTLKYKGNGAKEIHEEN